MGQVGKESGVQLENRVNDSILPALKQMVKPMPGSDELRARVRAIAVASGTLAVRQVVPTSARPNGAAFLVEVVKRAQLFWQLTEWHMASRIYRLISG